MLPTIWFCLIAFMLTMYVLLDGYDLGAGIVHLFVARTDGERRMVLRSIGPVWDGNEVWLIAGGGTLYFAFPHLYAASFSGFYLPLIMVLWLLILRGISIEFRSHIESEVWKPAWDAVFALASLLLVVFLGAALGNVVRGVPLTEERWFFNPLWTTFSPAGERTGILDWYTVTVGVTAFFALAAHGALWVAFRTEGELRLRARRAAGLMWLGTLVFTALVTVATFIVQPLIPEGLASRPWGWIFPAAALFGLFSSVFWSRRGQDLRAFLASGGYVVGMMGSVAVALYPYLLPSILDLDHSITVDNAAAADYGLGIGLVWWTPAVLLALGYSFYVHKRFSGKVTLEGEGY